MYRHTAIPQSKSQIFASPLYTRGPFTARFLLQFSLSCDKINKKEAVVMIEQIMMVSNCLLRKDYVHDNCKQ